MIIGTPEYMSPEQVEGIEADPRFQDLLKKMGLD